MNTMSGILSKLQTGQPEPRFGELAVLLVSCDMYKDLWPLCTAMMHRFWPDCPYPAYLVCNQPASIPGFRTLAVGSDRGWSANLIRALEEVEEEFVLLFLEDLILEQPVSTPRVVHLFNWFKGVSGNCLRMNPSPRPDEPCNEFVGIASKGGLYRSSTVMTLWRKSVLYALLRPEENAWEFEILGTKRSDQFDGFYAAYDKTFSFVNAVARGKWGRRALRRVRRLGVEPDLAARGVLSHTAEWKGCLLEIRHGVLAHMPARWRRTIRQALIG
jgi:hypothetical protein